MTNEEPLVVMKACVDVVWEVVREDRGDGCDGVVREGETPLRCGRYGSVRQRTFGTEDGHIGCGWGVCGHWRSEVFASRGSDEDVVRVNGDVFMKRSKEEGVEDFLSDSRRGGRHGR